MYMPKSAHFLPKFSTSPLFCYAFGTVLCGPLKQTRNPAYFTPPSSASEKIRFLKDIDRIRLRSPGVNNPYWGKLWILRGENLYIYIHIYVQWTIWQWLRHCKTWSHLVFIFFLLCVGSLEVKYLFVNVLFINIRKKQRERNTPMRNICFASKWNIFLYINIYIQITLWRTERKFCFFAIFIIVCGMKYQCVKKKIFDGKTSKNIKRKEKEFLSTWAPY